MVNRLRLKIGSHCNANEKSGIKSRFSLLKIMHTCVYFSEVVFVEKMIDKTGLAAGFFETIPQVFSFSLLRGKT